jgi:hypothetical protein
MIDADIPRRKGMDTDMAATILFLAGKGGVFYNEQILYPDGGAYSCVPLHLKPTNSTQATHSRSLLRSNLTY